MSDEKKQAEMDWAFADRACTRLIDMMALVPQSHAFYEELKGELKDAKAKRREAGDRLAAAAMAQVAAARLAIQSAKDAEAALYRASHTMVSAR